MLTSSKGLEEWGDVLGGEVMAAALSDRLLHHCYIVNIRGDSYRMLEHIELAKIPYSTPVEQSSRLYRPWAKKRNGQWIALWNSLFIILTSRC